MFEDEPVPICGVSGSIFESFGEAGSGGPILAPIPEIRAGLGHSQYRPPRRVGYEVEALHLLMMREPDLLPLATAGGTDCVQVSFTFGACQRFS
jgi:hypothetical protein